MSRAAAAQRPREQPHNFCGRHRAWVPSQEVVQLFAGEGLRPELWLCPPCRAPRNGLPEGPGANSSPANPVRRVPVPPGPETRVIDPDTAEHRDRRYGPVRQIVEVLVKPGEGTNRYSMRVRLECGHETTTADKAKTARCAACRVKEG